MKIIEAIRKSSIADIEIITPIELLNKHLEKLKKPLLKSNIEIDDNLMKKKFPIADLIICDDSNLLSFEFINYLKHIQKKSSLLLVSRDKNLNATFKFKKNFRLNDLKVLFKHTNQYAKALQLISHLLREEYGSRILVVSNEINKGKLNEDLEFFIKDRVNLLETNDNLLSQKLENLILCSYSQISAMNSRFVILLDVQETSLNKVQHALSLAEDTTFLLYEEMSENIEILRNQN